MLNLILNLSILVVALPLSALAASHGHILNRRHSGLAKRADSDVALYPRGPNSHWSFYDVETGQAGSCGQFRKNADFVVAMNAGQMNPGLCFKSIRMTYAGKTTYATVTDTCPGCPPNGLDLTEGLFSFFAPHSVGIIYGDWEFADAAPAPAPPPPPPPKPVYTPPPPPTTTRVAPTPTTTSTTPRPSSSSSRASSSAISASNSINSSSGVASPSASSSKVSPESNNLDGIGQAFVQLGSLVVAGNSVSA